MHYPEPYEPTEEEIAEVTRAIRETWSEEEWNKRIADPKKRRKDWELPEVKSPEFEDGESG